MEAQQMPPANTVSPPRFAAPRQLRGLWELTIVATLVLPLAGATFLRGSTDTSTFVVADGIVTVLLVAAYVLVAGWTAPSPHRWPSSART